MNSVDQWSDFFTASVGASAALVGLVIVAISVNVRPILDNPSLPQRAGSTISILVLVLASTSVGLIKSQPLRALGIELAIFGLVALVPGWQSSRASLRITPRRPWPELLLHIVLAQLTALVMVAAGAVLIAGDGDGFYLVVAAVISGYVVSCLNAWVLLIEILR